MIIAALELEAQTYRWLAPDRVRQANDPDLAATVARLYEEREQQRLRAEVAEQAVEVLQAELRRHNQPADAVEPNGEPL